MANISQIEQRGRLQRQVESELRPTMVGLNICIQEGTEGGNDSVAKVPLRTIDEVKAWLDGVRYGIERSHRS